MFFVILLHDHQICGREINNHACEIKNSNDVTIMPYLSICLYLSPESGLRKHRVVEISDIVNRIAPKVSCFTSTNIKCSESTYANITGEIAPFLLTPTPSSSVCCTHAFRVHFTFGSRFVNFLFVF